MANQKETKTDYPSDPNKTAYITDKNVIMWKHKCPYGKFVIELSEKDICECGDRLEPEDKWTIKKMMADSNNRS